MKKIPTMFVREFDGHKIVNITPVFTNEVCRNALLYGNPTIKFDGAACAVFDGKLYKRFDLGKAKKGAPQGRKLIMCESKPDPQTGHWPAWLECSRDDNADKWFFEAFDRWFSEWTPKHGPMQGTYEAIGPHFQGNPYNIEFDKLVRHGAMSVAELFPKTDAQRIRELDNGELGTRRYKRTLEGVKQFLEDSVCEGLVFWDSRKPLCKIKRSDFGLPWNVKGGKEMNAPCYMCEKRSATCHSTCEDYKDYAAGRAEACHNKKADVRAVGYFIDQCRKRRRKWVKRVYK